MLQKLSSRLTFAFTFTLFSTATLALWAQNVSPPPGFSPSPPPAKITNGGLDDDPNQPGLLQRLGSPKPARQTAGDDNSLEYYPDSDPASQPFSPPVYPPQDRYYPPPPHPVIVAPAVIPPRFWFRAEALYWWTSASPISIPLVTTGSTGVIGAPDTNVVIGNENVSFSGRGGGRFTLGFALDSEAIWALEGNYFFLSPSTVNIGTTSDGSPGSAPLYFPYFNPATGQESSTLIAMPGGFAGTAVVTLQDFVQGAEANLLFQLSNSGSVRWDGLAGVRYFNLRETLTFTTDSPNVPPNPSNFFNTYDQFDAQNNFYGGQIGVKMTYENPWLFFNGTAKLALGGTSETVVTNGWLSSSAGGAAGGYLTQPSNLGSISQTQFAVMPGLDLNFGIRLSPWASVVVGYSFLYVSSVARPGNQLDHSVNASQSPLAFGPAPASNIASPALVLRDSDFWAQGLTFTLEIRY